MKNELSRYPFRVMGILLVVVKGRSYIARYLSLGLFNALSNNISFQRHLDFFCEAFSHAAITARRLFFECTYARFLRITMLRNCVPWVQNVHIK